MYADDDEGRLAEITDAEQMFQAGGMSNEQLLEWRKRLSGGLLRLTTTRTPSDQKWAERASALSEAIATVLIDRGVNPFGVEMNPRYGQMPWDRFKGK